MSFLVWSNEQDAEDSLTAINDKYGCPYSEVSGYQMDEWDKIMESWEGKFGFYKPEERLSMTMDDLMPALTSGYTEHDVMPEEFRPLEEEV